MIDPSMRNRTVYSSQLGRSNASDISRTPLGGGDSTDQTSQANLRKLNFTNTLYLLAYSQELLQHLNSVMYYNYNYNKVF